MPRAGSRATSVKGEPGSAVESNAASSVKDKNVLSPNIGHTQKKILSRVSHFLAKTLD